MLAVTAQTIRQLTVDGFFRGCTYGLLGAGFALILGVTGRFHFAYGLTYVLAVYFAFTFTFLGAPPWIYYVGCAVALIRLWTNAAPTRGALERDQADVTARGSALSLVAALRAGSARRD